MNRARSVPAFSIAVLAVALGGCGKKNEFVAPPPPEVDVQLPIVRNETVFLEFPGRTQAYARIEIRARVKGFLKTREFKPGQFVEKDQTLFTIEPEQFDAAVKGADGRLAKARADLEISKANLERRRIAGKTGAVSEIDVLSAEADMKAAEANVEIATAALNDAKRDLSYTEVVTPIAGRVSRERVDIGNLVGSGDPTLLTTVVQDNPLYVNFEVNERTILPYLKNRPNAARKDLETGSPDSEGDLRLTLADGSEYATKGRFDFIDNAVDSQTGTVKVRAIFTNKGGALADGLFVRIGIPEPIENAVLVPRMALQRDLGGTFALVVGKDDMVERRIVKRTQFTVGEFHIIEAWDEETKTGLKPDERIVTSNLQRARPGIKVAPKKAEAKPEPAPGEVKPGPEGGETGPEKPPGKMKLGPEDKGERGEAPKDGVEATVGEKTATPPAN